MAIKLYSWPHSSGTRISWALEELGVPYEYIELDREKGQNRAPQYLAVNPQGKVPGLVDGDLTFFESGAILLYLADKYGVEKKLWPAGGQDRADAVCWTVWAMADFGPYMMQYAYHGLDSPVSYQAADRSSACAAYNHSQFVRGLDALQARLQDRDHLLGADFSLADIPAASMLQFGKMLGIKFDGHPRVADWLKRCSARPACRKAK